MPSVVSHFLNNCLVYLAGQTFGGLREHLVTLGRFSWQGHVIAERHKTYTGLHHVLNNGVDKYCS